MHTYVPKLCMKDGPVQVLIHPTMSVHSTGDP